MQNRTRNDKGADDHPYIKDYTKRIIDEYESSITKHLNEEYIRNTKWADRLADKIAAFGGSWRFIMIFGLFLTAWITWNTVSGTLHFDPKPFILLNLVLSFIAAFQAPIIMMSQNRQEARDKHESLIDFAINYKAEIEINDIQGHLHRMENDITELKKLLLNLK
ncbi:DUF1003 domain-containing protein [Desulfitobacterium sp. Sab5]|uniref:DUF1003 domain-containing protein n=1 Tax=Desulfitobacterium nosdiversum TaxID=3375356 RepID=UPI003CE6D80D